MSQRVTTGQLNVPASFQRNSVTNAMVSSSVLILASSGVFAQELPLLTAYNNAITSDKLVQLSDHVGQTSISKKSVVQKSKLTQVGRIWLTEDPSLLQASLTIATVDKVAFNPKSQELQEAVTFSIYSNDKANFALQINF